MRTSPRLRSRPSSGLEHACWWKCRVLPPVRLALGRDTLPRPGRDRQRLLRLHGVRHRSLDAAAIERMVGHFETLLERPSTDPGLRLSGCPWRLRRSGASGALRVPSSADEGARSRPCWRPGRRGLRRQAAIVAGERSLSWSGCASGPRACGGSEPGATEGVGPEQSRWPCAWSRRPSASMAQWAVLEAGGAWVLVPPLRWPELASLAPEGAPVPLLPRTRGCTPACRWMPRGCCTWMRPGGGARARAPRYSGRCRGHGVSRGAEWTEADSRRAIHTPRTVAHLFHALDQGHGGRPAVHGCGPRRPRGRGAGTGSAVGPVPGPARRPAA